MNPVAQAAKDAGERLLGATEATLTELLNAALGQFASWPYRTAAGSILDRNGSMAGPFTLRGLRLQQNGADELNAITADNVAAVIDAYEIADMETLCSAYARVRRAKRRQFVRFY